MMKKHEDYLEGVEQGGINLICSGRQHAHGWACGAPRGTPMRVVGQHTALCLTATREQQQRHMAPELYRHL